jgi:hypothetical protein
VHFDASGLGGCIINTDVTVAGIRMYPEYTGILDQGICTVTAGPYDCEFNGGVFSGRSRNVQILGNVYFGYTQYICTDATTLIEGNFYFEPQTSTVVEDLVIEHIPLTPTDVANKYVSLSRTPDPTRAVLSIVHGGAQTYGVDYYIYGVELRWDGMALESLLSVGDELVIIYPTMSFPGFFHNNGTVSMNTINTRLTGHGVHFYDLQFRGDSTSYCLIDSSAYTDGRLILDTGNIRTTPDGTMIPLLDMVATDGFGRLGPYNDAYVLMNSSWQQIIYSSGGVIPSLYVDKTTTNQVICYGTGPIRVNGDFILNDGTFNMNGRELRVGVL